jgi:hypothetical protein
MNKEFVNYNTALALKELGFDEPCLAYYKDIKGEKVLLDDSMDFDGEVKAPLKQQAFRWFREKHDLQASNIIFSNGKYDTGITRYKGTQSVWGHGPIYDTYEEAEQACLDKLIEICKNK